VVLIARSNRLEELRGVVPRLLEVLPTAARRAVTQGIGSVLLARAEAHALETGATSVEIEASLAGLDFYRANGFIEVGRGETRLTTGRSMECVFMRKELSVVTP
jgi:GNAT superfamily N-acetyltransferase